MNDRRTARFLRPTLTTRVAVRGSLALIAGTAAYLFWAYPLLPDLLPVHFRWDGQPNGWQYRTVSRVLMPVLVQVSLLAAFASVSALLRSRRDARTAAEMPDAGAATSAAEAVMLMSAVWIAFQGYAAVALVSLWRSGGSSLGRGYTVFEAVCLVITLIVAARAIAKLGRPAPRPFDRAHWRWRELYCNAEDPALFVPTRTGGRWTLNFGRRAAVCLLACVLIVGVVLPSLMLALALR